MTGLADDPLKGHGAAFGTFDVCSFIRAKKDLFKEVAALKASKFKNGHDLLPNLLCFILENTQYKSQSPQSQMKLYLNGNCISQAKRSSNEVLLKQSTPQMKCSSINALLKHRAHSLAQIFMKTFRVLGPSKSQKKIFCQVPRTRRPFSTSTETELPIIEALIWLSAFPSIWRYPASRGTN